MDHLKFFDLPSDPFQNESDERFYYESAPQKRARLRILRGIHQRKALSVLVGGPGLGKTTLAHSLLRALDPREYAAYYLSIPHESCSSGWFLPNVARAFGVHAPSAQVQTLVDQIHAQLVAVAASRRSAVLLVDEAQLFRNRDAMEEFRGLLNLLHEGRKLVSLVLFGLHELGEILKLDGPLAQRVEIRVELGAMDWLESQAYVAHRLRLAGATQAVFAPDALEALFRWSGGVPRLLNTLADNALFEAYLAETRPVDSSIVAAAAAALGFSSAPVPMDPYPSMPTLMPLSGDSRPPADWLEPVAPMPVDVRERAPKPARAVIAQDTAPSLPGVDLLAEAPTQLSEAMEFELEEVLAEETSSPAEVELELEPEPEPEPVAEAEPEPEPEQLPELAAELESEDSDWSLGALVREEDEPLSDEERRRNEDSFDLRSLAFEDDEPVTQPSAPKLPAARPPAARPPVAAPAAPAKAAPKPPPKDEDDLDALFDEIQIGD